MFLFQVLFLLLILVLSLFLFLALVLFLVLGQFPVLVLFLVLFLVLVLVPVSGSDSGTSKWKMPAYSPSLKLWSCGTTRARTSSFRVSEAMAASSQQSPGGREWAGLRSQVKVMKQQLL